MMHKLRTLAALLAIPAASALAQAGDPPSRVARLNLTDGQVSFRPGSVEEWTAATVNYPMTTGDHLWTDGGAKAEMHVGSTAIRMDASTALSILNLDDRLVQLSLTEGAIDVHIRYLGENDSFEVDTPNVSISLLRAGDYRINADGDNNVSVVAVRGGEAEVTAGGRAFPIRAGQSGRLAGMDSVSQEIAGLPPADAFDDWSLMRSRREEAVSVSARYVPREMIGYEDLDRYGTWRNVPPYGWVWSPSGISVGWAPYHNGRWAWVDPWGWTWVDEAPWGFAPFHYGRWASAGGGWVWIPGAIAVRPVYAPALVAFVAGPRFGVSVGIGGGVGVAAWFALGPGEVYRPAYHVSEGYVERVNVAHVTNVTVINNVNITNVHYANQTVVGAVTAVPHDAFVSARPVASVAVVVPQREIAAAQVTGSTAMVAPTRQSVVANAAVSVRTPPARFTERAVVARTPPPAPPVRFADKEQALRANQGRPLDAVQMNAVRQNAPPPRGPAVRTIAPAGQPEMLRPQPALRNDRPPNAQVPQRSVEPARVAEPRPTAAEPGAHAPGKAEQKAAQKNKKKTDKTDKKDEKKDR